VPQVRPRRLAITSLLAASLVVATAVVAADGLGDGTALRSAAAPDERDVLVAPGAPPRFSKQVELGPGHAAPTTTGTDATGSGAGTAAVQAAGAPSASPRTAPAPPVTTAAPAPAPVAESPAVPSGLRCVVRLHGKGGGGGSTHTIGEGLVEVAPAGNGSAWGGREWAYFPESGYAAAKGSVTAAVDAAGCGQIILDGFSNGAAFAAKLYCRGETFGGRLVGVIIDDPVVDHAVEGCRPAGGVRVVLYWTGALTATSAPGWNCADQDWTCEGGTTIGIDAYQAALGVARTQSANSTHAWYTSPPELSSWW
jgi:hypothetical protein